MLQGLNKNTFSAWALRICRDHTQAGGCEVPRFSKRGTLGPWTVQRAFQRSHARGEFFIVRSTLLPAENFPAGRHAG